MTLRLSGIEKSYGAAKVLNGVSMTLPEGRVMALLGPNGAGKSTLVGCLTGALAPDCGRVDFDGRSLIGKSPAEVRGSGVAAIYQSFSLVGSMSVVDNIFLGRELRNGPFIDRAAQRRGASRVLKDLGSPAEPDDLVSDLPVGVRQLVEIAKAVHDKARVVILDEPTAALSGPEVAVLLDRVRDLARRGVAVLYVSHRLEEVLAVCDDVTVLRDGVVVESGPIGQYDGASLASAIAPGIVKAVEVEWHEREVAPAASGEPSLAAENLRTGSVGPVDLTVREAEIVAVFGMLGAGRTEILEAIAGARGRSGSVRVQGDEIPPGSVRRAVRAGVALVPGDRKTGGIFEGLAAGENVVLPHLHSLSRRGLRRRARERATYARVAGQLGVVPDNWEIPAWALSGGNQQKLVVGRWLPASGLRVLLLDEPTQGVDVGARVELYRSLAALSAAGLAIAFASSDPAEVLALAHRVVVLSDGRVTLDAPVSRVDEHELLSAA